MPRGAGGMPTRWNLPSVRLSRAIGRSPCSTWISTDVWLSAAVEKISLFRVGMVHAGIGKSLLAGADRALKDVFHHRFELRPRELEVQMLRSRRIRRNERQRDLRFLDRRQLHLGLFRSFF